jgi:hypothetical protein
MPTVRVIAPLIFLLTAFAGSAAASELAAAERAKIESLIVVVERLEDAKFVRNGKAYGPATAGKFLRGKWKDRASHVRSADDFINHVATRSSTTGRPYVIRLADGREVPAAVFLRAELKKLR